MRNENIDKSCINCTHSNGEQYGCYCSKKGMVDPSSVCKRYEMDLLKLKPRPPLNLNAVEKIEL